jgi:hypothetical protein
MTPESQKTRSAIQAHIVEIFTGCLKQTPHSFYSTRFNLITVTAKI